MDLTRFGYYSVIKIIDENKEHYNNQTTQSNQCKYLIVSRNSLLDHNWEPVITLDTFSLN